jgi:PAS domain S-box-containing protein
MSSTNPNENQLEELHPGVAHEPNRAGTAERKDFEDYFEGLFSGAAFKHSIRDGVLLDEVVAGLLEIEDKSTATESATAAPVPVESIAAESLAAESMADGRIASAPVTAEPAPAEPVAAAELVAAEPIVTESAVAEPVAAEPAAVEPVAVQPTVAAPTAVEAAAAGPTGRSTGRKPLAWMRRLLAAPVFEGDEEKTRVARLLNTVLLGVFVGTVLITLSLLILRDLPSSFEEAFVPLIGVVLLLVIGGLLALARRGHLRAVSTTFVSLLWTVITYWVYGFAGIGSDQSPLMYTLIIVLTGLLLGRLGAVVATVTTLVAVVGAFYLETQGLIPVPSQPATPADLAFVLMPLSLTGLLLSHAVQSLTRALQRVRHSAHALAERTSELEASQRVTFAASERTSPDELLGLVVNLIRDQFDLYHVQVYVVDEEQQAAMLRKSTGYAGRQLLQKKHHIPLDRTALVTKAIRERVPVLVTDVSKDPNFMPNPLLPETQSELVVPLKISERVIGVLDAQDRVPGRFTESTVALFQTMGDQIAFLFENSELLERVSEQTEALTIFTNQLRTAADIARRLGTILDPDVLLQQVVELMQGRFGLYHVHIYLLDEETHQLIVHAGSGEVGRVLCERGHSILVGTKKSLVARAVRERETVLVNDTSLESDFMPNPLLPQTRSEMSVPLMIGDRVLGVLDVQDDQVNRFTQSDQDTFGTLAGQIAITLENASLFEEQQRAQKAIRESEERLRAILETSPIPTVVSRLSDGIVLYANRQLSEMIGLPPDGWIGRQTPDFYYDPADRQMILKALQRDGHLRHKELQLKRTDGTPFWALLSMQTLMFDEQPAVLSAIYDITARKQAEAERARFTKQLRTAADLAEQINAILDPDRLLHEVVNQLQDRFDLYHVHVYLLDEHTRDLMMHAGSGEIGDTLREQGHKIPLDRKRSLVARAARNQETVAVEDTSAEPDFMPNPLLPETRSEIAVPLIAGGRVLGVLDVQDNQPGRFTPADLDVFSTLAGQVATSLQNAAFFEETQKTAERLRELDRLKSEFLANMSHELRTPLNSIIGYTEIMLMGIDSELDPETLEDVQAIYDNSQHLLRLINDILDLAKIEAGHLTLNLEEVHIEPLLEEIKTSSAGLLVNMPLELRVEVNGDLPPFEADRVRLSQILNNLVSNAAKFTHEGSITLRAFNDDGWVCIEVEDTGVGISEEDLENIFERFTQADGSTTRRAEGTGLGLAITRHLVEMHGGEIDVRSKLGEGSTFIVRLPMQRHLVREAASV